MEVVPRLRLQLGCCCCSDVICEFPLKEMLAFHKAHNAEATLLVTKVALGMHPRFPLPDLSCTIGLILEVQRAAHSLLRLLT